MSARGVANGVTGNKTFAPGVELLMLMLPDLRYAVRSLSRNPAFTTVAVLALALGIGASSAIFSVVHALLLRPLPYRDSARLVVVWDQLSKLGLNEFPATFAHYFDYRNQNRVFDDIAAYGYRDFNLTGDDQPERILGARVSANLFPLLGAEAALGRTFAPEENEPGREAVVVLSHALWQRRFGADRNLLGKTLTLDGNPFTLIGILPPDFRFTDRNTSSPDVWAPLVFRPDPARRAGSLRLIARLKPDVSLQQARLNLKTIANGIEQKYHPYTGPHGEDAGYSVTVIPLREQIVGDMRQGLLVLLGAVGFVLLIACANVANLLLARAAARRKEIAIRQALGAGRFRLVRQLLTESVVLALLGGCLGLVLSYGGVDVLVALSPNDVSRLEKIGMDPWVLGFTFVLSLVTGVIFGLAPALQGSKMDLTESLKEGGRSSSPADRRRASQLLVVSEVALSLALVAGAGLLIQSFVRLQNVNPGFHAEKLMTAQISLPSFKYRENHQVAAFYRQVLERIRGLAGVQSASIASRLPLSGGGRGGDPFSIEGRPYAAASKTPQVVQFQVISPDYFRTMQIPLRAGRSLTARDADGSMPVVVINETMARGFWPHSDPVGQRVMLGAPRPGVPWLTIVGVVGDVRNSALDVAPVPQMYVPYLQNPARSMVLVTRTSSDALSLASAVRLQVQALDGDQPVYDVRTMEQRLSSSVAQPRFQTLVLGIFSAVALILAALGIYGVVAHSVAQRTHEIGIRMALGAQAASVLRLVVRQGMAPALIGMAIGLAGTLAISRVLGGLLYEVTATDPATFLGASLLLAGVALIACYIPARRATQVDPVVVLRCE